MHYMVSALQFCKCRVLLILFVFFDKGFWKFVVGYWHVDGIALSYQQWCHCINPKLYF